MEKRECVFLRLINWTVAACRQRERDLFLGFFGPGPLHF
jgi:hypothetical protein